MNMWQTLYCENDIRIRNVESVITLRYCSTQDTQTRRYDQILVLTHLQEREEIDKQKLWSENDALERTSACGSLGLENGGGHIVA